MSKSIRYCDDVISKNIPACKHVVNACKRFKADLKRKDIKFENDLYLHAVQFIEELEHSVGLYAGKKFLLEPWQHFIVANIFGFIKLDGTRRFTRAYVEVPRKNGKSTFSNAIMLYGLIADGEEGAQVYSAATKLDQAMMVFSEGARVCKQLDWLRDDVNVYNSVNNRRINFGTSVYRPLEWNPGKQDGLNTHFCCIDEYHAHTNDELYNVIRNSMGARSQPLLFTITTAGFNRESACYKHRDYCVKVLNGGVSDDALFSVIYSLDDKDDWTDSANWQKANPNWGVSVNPRQLEEGLNEARELPHKQVEFKTKLLNVWTDTATTWISDEKWNECVNEDEPTGICYGGLDLASTGDFCAFSLIWPSDGYKVKTWYWLPDNAAQRRNDQIGVSIRTWAQEGWIHLTDGNVTDYSFIKAKILELSDQFDIQEIAFDRFNATQLVIELGNEGMTMFPFGQGFVSMSAPTKELERLVNIGELNHDGNPVTRWMMSNILLRQDPAANIKIDKAKSGDKVDGPVSIVMALGTYMQEQSKIVQDGELWFTNI
jgi:phage terminase large subunit-like protein